MPYTATSFKGRLALAPRRWYDAECLYDWASESISLRIEVISEREAAFTALEGCIVDARNTQCPQGAEWVDSNDTKWLESFQKLYSFLANRSAAKGRSTDATGAASASTGPVDSNTQRAFQTSLARVIRKIAAGEDLTDRAAFEASGVTWQA